MATRKANKAGNLRPSAFRAHVEVSGDYEAQEMIREIGYRAAHTAPLMTKMVDLLQFMQARRMRQKPWVPPSEQTVERKVREGENPEIFRDESRRIKGTPTRAPDAAYDAITVPNFPGQIRKVTRTTATFGIDAKGKGKYFYMRFVQNTKGVKRRVLAISEPDAMTLLIETERWILEGRKINVSATGRRRYAP